ncbi:MAG: DUF1800 domain-containing protein [Caldimonas sp.]
METVDTVIERARPEGAPDKGTEPRTLTPIAIAAIASVALAACGGGGDASSGTGTGTGSGGGAPPAPTATEASRFLAQASMGASRTDIARVQAIGYSAWIDEQLAMPASQTRWDALVAAGFSDAGYKNSEGGFDACSWRKLLSSPDTLRQRVTLALSELMVTSIDSLVGGGWKAFAAAHYLDLLEVNAFGNYRTLMQQVSTNTAMGMYLTFRASKKANPVTGSLPDENYARELMQLFTIGLVQLNLDGTAKTSGGAPIATYALADITGLARVFTGWDFDLQGLSGQAGTATPDFMRRPMIQYPANHELAATTFLGTTIPANTDGVTALRLALDAIFGHANVAPFVSRQLIQRLVTSNPSPAYVARVAAVFNNDGSGTKGNLAAVLKAILLDDEARSAAVAAGVSSGKLREPMLRFTGWARAWSASSPSNAWSIGDTSSASARLGQSPLRSPTVFNFFRPGYVPPNSAIASAGLVAPEFQLHNESTVVGAVNYLQRAVSGAGVGDVAADYSSLVALADDAVALVAEINLVLAASQLSAATATTISTAVATIAGGTDPNRLKRIYAALTLAMAAPEFTVLK